ncbi:Os09g0411400 [Oryza sativa Japonica Group]|uniref:Os09g0411400 protein n=1 Tax=Oryza sativa subsp. japonica TaxID=39947 RepID=A0A0P0XLQ0_ORYSJ|nr:Os09g0411400 [Oryza sativa Japonica Group]
MDAAVAGENIPGCCSPRGTRQRKIRWESASSRLPFSWRLAHCRENSTQHRDTAAAAAPHRPERRKKLAKAKQEGANPDLARSASCETVLATRVR